jgi:hypothetical protein
MHPNPVKHAPGPFFSLPASAGRVSPASADGAGRASAPRGGLMRASKGSAMFTIWISGAASENITML